MSEFDVVEQRLREYRPIGPSAAAREKMAALLQAPPQAGAPTRGHWRWVAAAAAVVAILALGARSARKWMTPAPSAPATASATSQQPTTIPEAFSTAWTAQPRVDVPAIFSHATVVVVGFIDWPCTGCVTLYPRLREIEERYKQSMPGAVEVVVLDWPWNADCNSHVPAEGGLRHPASCVAAAAVRIARDRGRADAMIDWIVTNRATLEGPDWKSRLLAELQRLCPGVDFDREYARVLPAIQADADRGAHVGINTTPTVFVNGRSLGPAMPTVEVIDWAIRLELQGRIK
jgi:hypothetical protein